MCAVLASTDWPSPADSEIGRQLEVANIADPNGIGSSNASLSATAYSGGGNCYVRTFHKQTADRDAKRC